ncbi:MULTISPECIES: TIGR04197 family type VII secretion effector [Virgibacillus]|uniref:TIGR04197 family type VII secretion effector n=1 Tax=Virgibacillus dokdonensis TaxID=302167 RepID=A0A2K9J881_9BACI|nr:MULTISPECIES: TIGR04197 family type VII secretion effector [Virgibacillus]AUJ26911.1 hypothetical protein A21D_03877 [Virgibacillus dokdonensis]NWO13240.1 TIGR04197 family type VII secretion effector [Virgibacillus sp.]
MGEQVGINIEVFRENVSRLKAAVSNINSSTNKNWTFDKTNITPFTNDLENAVKAMTILERYVTLLSNDIDTLKNIGESMKEKDEELSKGTSKITSD